MRSNVIVSDLAAFEAEAAAFAKALPSAEAGATLVTLSGDLGAGKTAFTQTVAKALGIEETVTSPTFVLAKYYELPEGKPFSRLVHIDAYRLKSGSELDALNFSNIMSDAKTLVLLEWPEMVADVLPAAAIAVRLETLPDLSRSITYSYA